MNHLLHVYECAAALPLVRLLGPWWAEPAPSSSTGAGDRIRPPVGHGKWAGGAAAAVFVSESNAI